MAGTELTFWHRETDASINPGLLFTGLTGEACVGRGSLTSFEY